MLEEDLRQRAAGGGKERQSGDHDDRRSRRDDEFRPTHDQQAAIAGSSGSFASQEGRRALQHKVVLRLSAGPDVAVVQRAFIRLARRHSLLRLTVCGVSRQGDVELALGAAPKLRSVADVAVAVSEPLAVEQGELVRAAYARSGRAGDLGLMVHAAVTDRHGFSVLVEELLRLIDGQDLASAPPAQALHAVLARRQFDEGEPQSLAARAHWEAVLRQPVRPVAFKARGRALLPLRFGANRGTPASLSFDIKWRGPAEGIETTVLEGLAEALVGATGQSEFVIERVSDARAQDVPGRAVGPFEGRLPLVVRDRDNAAGLAPATQIRRQLRSGYRHEALGTAYVESEIVRNDQAAAALRQFGFRLQDANASDTLARTLRGIRVAGKPLRVVDDYVAGANLHDIDMAVVRTKPSSLRATITYDADCVSADLVREVADQVIRFCAVRTGGSPKRRTSAGDSLAPVPAAAAQSSGSGANRLVACDDGLAREVTADGDAVAVDLKEGRPSRPAAKRKASRSAGHGTTSTNGHYSVYPVTPGQKWMLDALVAPDCTRTMRQGLVLAQGVIVKPRLDVTRLRRAVSALTSAHEALRTRFEWNGTAWQAVVEAQHPTGLVVEDASGMSDGELGEKVERLIAEDYDVTRGPLFDIRLMHLGERGDAVLMRVHHAIVDAWSLIRLFESLFAAYMGSRLEFNPALSTAALFERMDAQARSRTAERNQHYWKSIVEPWLPTPKFGRVAKGIPLNLSGAWAPPRETIVTRVDGETFELLDATAKRAKITTNSLMMAAFAATLARAGDVDALYLASLYPRRTDPALRDFMGYLAADVPIRAECPPGAPVEQIAVALHRQAAQSYGLVDLNFFINDVFADAPKSAGAYPRAICSGLAPEHLARTSPFEPLLVSGPGHSFRFGAMEVHTLPVSPRNVDDSEISLRPMAGRTHTTLRLSYETLAFTREEAGTILDEMLISLGLAGRGAEAPRTFESFGAAQDWTSVALGQMPGPAAATGRAVSFAPDEVYRAAGE